VFRNRVNLYFDRSKKEIKLEIPCGGGFYSKKVVYYQLNYKVLGLEELIKPVLILKLVDKWIEELTCVEAEALFWRFINHDFEYQLDFSDWRIRYRTLSYEEIATKMKIKKQDVWKAVQRALKKLTAM